jgi:N-methylhydantoinase A/oxoprolinase/acetone carboxylase beta subunit
VTRDNACRFGVNLGGTLPHLVLVGENGRIGSRKVLSDERQLRGGDFGGIRPAQIGRARLMGHYDMDEECPGPVVPRLWCVEVAKRLDHRGEVVRPLEGTDSNRRSLS